MQCIYTRVYSNDNTVYIVYTVVHTVYNHCIYLLVGGRDIIHADEVVSAPEPGGNADDQKNDQTLCL